MVQQESIQDSCCYGQQRKLRHDIKIFLVLSCYDSPPMLYIQHIKATLMKEKENPSFDVLSAISVLSKKLAKSKLDWLDESILDSFSQNYDK